MKRSVIAFLFSLFLFDSAIADSGVDLHQHLLMKHGVGWLLQGDFVSPLGAKVWNSRMGSRANRDTLATSKLGIVVVSLYVHPVLSQKWAGGIGGVVPALEAQVAELEDFVKNSKGDWIIARTASEAKLARAQGKKVFVLSLETAAGILETDQDLVKWIDQSGIRIVTFMHLTPDHLGGVALWPGIGFFNAPLDWLRSWISGDRDEHEHYINRTGLSSTGKVLLEKLAQRKVWIDLAHSSDQTQRDMFEILDRYHQPALYTHTSLRKFMGAERGVSEEQMKRVKATGGVVGLFASEMMTNPVSAPPPASELQACYFGFEALVQEWKEAVEFTSASQIMLGSDFNAPLDGIRPGCEKTLDTELIKRGFMNAHDVPRLWSALREMGAPVPIDLKEHERAFLDAWSKVNP